MAPIVPPEKAREYNELSPEHAGRRMSIIGSPDFHDYAAQDSPVALQPCPDEFLDDGFSDLLEDLEVRSGNTLRGETCCILLTQHFF